MHHNRKQVNRMHLVAAISPLTGAVAKHHECLRPDYDLAHLKVPVKPSLPGPLRMGSLSSKPGSYRAESLR